MPSSVPKVVCPLLESFVGTACKLVALETLSWAAIKPSYIICSTINIHHRKTDFLQVSCSLQPCYESYLLAVLDFEQVLLQSSNGSTGDFLLTRTLSCSEPSAAAFRVGCSCAVCSCVVGAISDAAPAATLRPTAYRMPYAWDPIHHLHSAYVGV